MLSVAKHLVDPEKGRTLLEHGIVPIGRFVAGRMKPGRGRSYASPSEPAYDFIAVDELMRGLWRDPQGTLGRLWEAARRQKADSLPAGRA